MKKVPVATLLSIDHTISLGDAHSQRRQREEVRMLTGGEEIRSALIESAPIMGEQWTHKALNDCGRDEHNEGHDGVHIE